MYGSVLIHCDELLSPLLFVSIAGSVIGELSFCINGLLFRRLEMKLPFDVVVVELGNEITGIWVETMPFVVPCARCIIEASLNWSLLFTLLFVDIDRSLLFRSDLVFVFNLIICVHSAFVIFVTLPLRKQNRKVRISLIFFVVIENHIGVVKFFQKIFMSFLLDLQNTEKLEMGVYYFVALIY